MAFTSNSLLSYVLSWRNFRGREIESKEHSWGGKCVSAHYKYSLKPKSNPIPFKCERRGISHLVKWLLLLVLAIPFTTKYI